MFTGENWELISQHLKDRTDQQCQQRWTKVVNPNLVKGMFDTIKNQIYAKSFAFLA